VNDVKRLLVILYLLAALCYNDTAKAQDASFSQVYSAPLYLSPSFAGFTSGGRVVLNYRDQWPGLANTYRTYAFSYDEYLRGYNSGVGLLFVRDDQGGGQLVTQNLGVNYAYELAITEDVFVRPGLQFKFAERKIDPSRLTQIGPGGETFPWINADFPQEHYRKLDASASAMVYSDFYWMGFTVDHLVKNNYGFTDVNSPIPIKTLVYGGWKYVYQEAARGRDEQSASLAFMYRRQQDFHQLDMGVYWYTNPIEVGLWYRGIPGMSSGNLSNNDALIFSLGVNIGTIHMAYSYDLSLSGLAGYSGGSNEFSIIYRFNRGPVVQQSRGPMPCSEPGQGLGESRFSRQQRRKLF
jgi:type IX secretion system PorP/SprF family membrane protein